MPSTSIFRVATAPAARMFTLLAIMAAMVHFEPASAQLQGGRILHKRAVTYNGCYSSSTPLTSGGTNIYQSKGSCQDTCGGSSVFAMTKGDACWCGDELPSLADKVDLGDCSTPCQGFPDDMCGSNNLWSVYATDSGVDNYGGSSSSSSSSSKSSTSSGSKTSDTLITSTQLSGGQTVVVTVPATVEATATGDSKSGGGGGGSTAGIAAGVVVGVVVIAAIIGGVYFFLRRKRRLAAEEDFKQRTQVSDFMRGGEGKPPQTGYSGMSDARLDPEAGRRDSLGSLADNQDYSRRILRVANPSD